MKAFLLFTKV